MQCFEKLFELILKGITHEVLIYIESYYYALSHEIT